MMERLVPTLLRTLVPLALPAAASWVEDQERVGLTTGCPLTRSEQADAAALGVCDPNRVRLVRVARMPLPGNGLLRRLARAAGVLSPDGAGLCLRHAIFIREPFWRERRLVIHELVHTAQYERLGGVRPFLRRYVEECLTVGYLAAPMEREANEAVDRLCVD